MLDTDIFKNINYIYVSHRHNDHFDSWFLKQLDKEIQVLIPKFRDKRLRNDFRKLGFKNIRELKDGEVLKVDDINITIFPEDGYLDSDSSILFEVDGKKYFNLNDCHPPFDTIKDKVGDIDLLMLQASSAIWWPYAYEYDQEYMNEKGKIKRENTINRALKYIEILQPKHVVPNAGPPVFLSKRYRELDTTRREKTNSFPLLDEIHDIFFSKGLNSLLLAPGDIINDDFSISYKSNLITDAYDNYDDYLKNMITEKAKYNDSLLVKKYDVSVDECLRVIDKFIDRIKEIKKISRFFIHKIDFPILFEFQDVAKIYVDFRKDNCVSFYGKHYGYKFVFNPIKVALLFRNEYVDFDDYLLGMNFAATREPDEYNEFIFAILKNFDSKRLRVAEFLYSKMLDVKEEYIEVSHNNQKYKCQRHCPHMKADLKKHGYVNEKGQLVCPIHHWYFDLETGTCEQSKNHVLKVEKINE